MRPYNPGGTTVLEPKETELKWGEDMRENKFLSSIGKDNKERRLFSTERSPGGGDHLSMSVGLQAEKGNGSSNSFFEGRFRGRIEDENVKLEKEKHSSGYRLPYFAATKLDLNSHDENDVASSCKQFDLNGFSWS